MKRCHQCGSTFSDDNSFCLDDGSVLVADMQMPFGNISADQPTQVVNRTTPATVTSAPARWPYVLIGMLAAAVLALGVVLLLQPQAGESTGKQPATTSTRPTATDTPATMTSATPAANAIPASSPTIPRISPAGSWRGNWSSPSGAYLKFDLDLSESGDRSRAK